MRRTNYLINAVFILLIGGCQQGRESVSEEIDRMREQAEAVPSQAPGAGQNIRVVVNLLTTTADEYSSIEALFKYVDRNVTAAADPAAYDASGLIVGVGSENFRLRLSTAARRLEAFEDIELFIALADGASGFISIGTEIAVPRFRYAGRWYNNTDYDFRQAGRSLEVTARSRPDGLIEMQLTPVFSNFLSDGGDLAMAELTTTITVAAGQTVVVGGSEERKDSAAWALLSHRQRGRRTKTVVTVTPYFQ
jgi:hypothetical protein